MVARPACFRISLISAIARRASPGCFIGDEVRNHLPVSRDHEALATLDFVEQLIKPRLRDRCRNFLHDHQLWLIKFGSQRSPGDTAVNLPIDATTPRHYVSHALV